MATRIDGKALAAKVKGRVAAAVKTLPRCPGLAVVLVGDDPASQVYVRGKEADCAECGIRSFPYRLPGGYQPAGAAGFDPKAERRPGGGRDSGAAAVAGAAGCGAGDRRHCPG